MKKNAKLAALAILVLAAVAALSLRESMAVASMAGELSFFPSRRL